MRKLFFKGILTSFTLVLLMGCDSKTTQRSLELKSESVKKQEEVPKQKKLTLKGKVAAYNRTELERLLGEYFAVQKLELESEKAKSNYEQVSKRTRVKNREDYIRQIRNAENALKFAQKVSLYTSSSTIARLIIEYLPEEYVWYEASHKSKIYLVGKANTIYQRDERRYRFNYNLDGPAGDEIRCRKDKEERLVVTTPQKASKCPLDTTEGVCS